MRLLRLEAAQRREDAFSNAGEAALAQAAAGAGAWHGAAMVRLAGVQAAGEAAQQRVAGLQQARSMGLPVLDTVWDLVSAQQLGLAHLLDACETII